LVEATTALEKECNMSLLKKGDLLTSTLEHYTVVKPLGEGGQGEVYLVHAESGDYAVKWFYKSMATEAQYHAIESLVEQGAPSEQFIWPMAIVENHSEDQFGYVMPLIDSRYYQKLTRFFSGELTFKSYEKLIEACMQMVQSFYTLHLSGLCYRDISFGNLFVNFKTGDVRICDNDNVTYDHLKSVEDNWGTYGFMAPEVIVGEAPPSTATDLFALSVVLFRMLYRQHPLQGRREYEIDILDEAAFMSLYGTRPIYIFDPIDVTNRPVKGVQDIAEFYRGILPQAVNDAFERAFTNGIKVPEERLRESEWMKLLTTVKYSITYCLNCGKQVFYDASVIRDKKEVSACVHCGKPAMRLPVRMKVGEQIIVLNYDSTLMMDVLTPLDMTAYQMPFASIVQHPRHPEIWGLKNHSELIWQYTTQEGDTRTIEKNGVVPLRHGMMINFGDSMGVVRF
jgi:serine/threonine protein kinase